MRNIRQVAVLGAGTMGARIAAHFANAGVSVLLLDLTADAARKGLETALKGKPGGFFLPEYATRVSPGSFDADLPQVAGCDWILEAVTEKLDVKRELWTKVAALRRADSIVSTNTSGIPLAQISAGFDAGFRQHFLGTHFFNPPRYLHLCEVIPGDETNPLLLADVERFLDRRMGKGVVVCKDTPNFIANRIGSMWGASAYQYTMEDDLTIEEVDALTGSVIGLPNSASYRLLDIVGLDIWVHVAENLYGMVPHDPWRERLKPPPFVDQMMANRWLGEKTGQGFYKRVGPEKEIQALDWKTLEYRKANKPRLAPMPEELPARLRMLVKGDDKYGRFVWKVLRDAMWYSAWCVPEIADRTVEIDRAMRWGYAHTYGPFELWDVLGFEATAKRMQQEGLALPAGVETMLERGAKSFYRSADEKGQPRTDYFDLGAGHYQRIAERPGVISLADRKRAGGVVRKNAGCSLVDLGDGCLCLEFHSKMNVLGEDQVGEITEAIAETQRNHQALVIGNQGDLFSAGANLVLVLMLAQEGEWDDLNLAAHRFQQANMAIKYAPVPVVVAGHGRALGGGAEILLHAPRAVASAELYMGLVEVGVGVIPGAGGCKEMIVRLKDPRKVFETIGYAKVSGSADEAKQLGLLDKGATVVMNPERLLGVAKAEALAMVDSYRPGVPRTDVKVAGEPGIALLKTGAWMAQQGGYITDYDVVIAGKLAHVLCGGAVAADTLVSEQQLLDLEREAFLSLCGNAQTQARMAHMLKTGKPLRN
jgi:3-hydroxyacyl-CoA dehydrogenase